MLEMVESAGVFGGYLEDLCYTPKTLKAIASVQAGAIGDVTWVRSRETHPGPHSAWFWDGRLTGGGAIIDLGCHCIEIVRNFVGKGNRPVEVLCHTDTLVHPIADEDNAVALIKFESGAIGQFEVSWTFRGGMDLRDEVAGTHGTIWMDHFLRTGFEMFSAPGAGGGYVAEKAESTSGWLFPVGDEVSELGYVDMFSDMFRAIDGGGKPQETFYDGMSSTRSWTPAIARRRPRLGAGRAGVARRLDAPHRSTPETVRGPGRHQARDPARRAPQAPPQAPRDPRLHRPHRGRLTIGSRRPRGHPLRRLGRRRRRSVGHADRRPDRPSPSACRRDPRRGPCMNGCLGRWRRPAPPWAGSRSCCSTSTWACRPAIRSAATRSLKRQLPNRRQSGPPASSPSTWTDAMRRQPVPPTTRRSPALGGLDLVVLGLGANGHVGMNEPGTLPDAADPRHRPRAVHDGRRPGVWRRPTAQARGVTLGLAGILAAREIWLVGERRPQGGPSCGPPSRARSRPTCRRPLLRGHPGLRVIADDAAQP